MLKQIVDGTLTIKSGRELFATLLERTTDDPDAIDTSNAAKLVSNLIDELGLRAVSGGDELDAILEAIIAANPGPADDVRNGKQQALGPLIGQVMKQLKGADAKSVREQLLKKLTTQ